MEKRIDIVLGTSPVPSTFVDNGNGNGNGNGNSNTTSSLSTSTSTNTKTTIKAERSASVIVAKLLYEIVKE